MTMQTAASYCSTKMHTAPHSSHMMDSSLPTQHGIMRICSCSVGSTPRILFVSQHPCLFRYPCSARVTLIKHLSVFVTHKLMQRASSEGCTCCKTSVQILTCNYEYFMSPFNDRCQDHMKCPLQSQSNPEDARRKGTSEIKSDSKNHETPTPVPGATLTVQNAIKLPRLGKPGNPIGVQDAKRSLENNC